MIRAGVIRNLKSHRNKRSGGERTPDGVLEALPDTVDDLTPALRGFAAAGVELLVIDGGDGTVRDVISRAPEAFDGRWPLLAVVPSGKTNVLALDLGMRLGDRLQTVLDAAATGRRKVRACLEVVRAGAGVPELRGYAFGTSAYVRATELAKRPHAAGLVDNLGVALTLGGAAAQTLAGRAHHPWRAGDRAKLRVGDVVEDRRWFVLVASTLKRLPLGLKPFGEPHEGLKLLTAQAPPERLWAALPLLLAGRERPWLEAAGYRRRDVDSFGLECEGQFVLDGELFPGGALDVRQGPDLEFLIP